jgi:hypothetical protein
MSVYRRARFGRVGEQPASNNSSTAAKLRQEKRVNVAIVLSSRSDYFRKIAAATLPPVVQAATASISP